MLHTFVGPDIGTVKAHVKDPFKEYLRTSVDLWGRGWDKLKSTYEANSEALTDYAFERYFNASALFGTPETCMERVKDFQEIGVHEIACLIDFGVDEQTVLAHLPYINSLRLKLSAPDITPYSIENGHRVSHVYLDEGGMPTLVSVGRNHMNSDNDINLRVGYPYSERLAALRGVTSVIDPQINAMKPGKADGFTDVTPADKVRISETVITILAEVLRRRIHDIPSNRSFQSMGIDSVMAVGITGRINSALKLSVQPTILFEYPTVEQLVTYLHSGVPIVGGQKAMSDSGGTQEHLNDLTADELYMLLMNEINSKE